MRGYPESMKYSQVLKYFNESKTNLGKIPIENIMDSPKPVQGILPNALTILSNHCPLNKDGDSNDDNDDDDVLTEN